MNESPAITRIRSAEQRRARAIGSAPWVLLALALLAFGIAFLTSTPFHDAVVEAWDVLASGDQERIRDYLHEFGAWAPVVSVLLMTLQVIFAPIPASVVQLANGVVFGVIPGTILNIIGQMLGATAAFFIARSLGRHTAERLAGRIDDSGTMEQWLHRWGARALLLVRVVPGMPSDFVSYLMGLTSMPARQYLLVSLVGYIPQSLAYAWLGDAATAYFWWIVLGGFGISSLLAAVIWIVQKQRPRPMLQPEIEPQSD